MVKGDWWLPGPGKGEGGRECLMGLEFQFHKMKIVLEVYGGDGCTTVRMYLMPLNCTLTNG